MTLENTLQIARKGEESYEELKAELERKFSGQWLEINVDTGEYVIGATSLEVLEKFEKQFGTGTPSWSTQIGRTTRI